MAATDNNISMKFMSYNMHGFHQGCPAVDDAIGQYSPDLILLQEHWLTPANLYLFDDHFGDYFSFGSSPMSKIVEAGMLRGRPFGGVVILIKNSFRKLTEAIHCSDRYAIVKVGSCLFVNVYLPCAGTLDRQLVCDDVLGEIDAWLSRYSDCEIVVAGDFNVNLDCGDNIASSICEFASINKLIRCDELFPTEKRPTYVNLALGHETFTDYILASGHCQLSEFFVLDPDINFSDHLPLFATIKCIALSTSDKGRTNSGNIKTTQPQLRWDQADLFSFYNFSGEQLRPLLVRLDEVWSRYSGGEVVDDVCAIIDNCYQIIADVLVTCAKHFVPVRSKCFYKFWWDEELDILKEAAVVSDRMWKASGKPRHGPIFDRRQHTRLQYRKRIREGKRMSDNMFTNELHDALLRKDGPTFWKCWRSKFGPVNKSVQVDGCVDADTIAEKFAVFFNNCYSCNNVYQKESLENEYSKLRKKYFGFPSSDISFDTELVSKVITELKRGKAADIEGLSNEHLIFSHPILPVILSRFFNLILCTRYIPVGFKRSYIVPIPKPNDVRTKALTCNDFRGIAISPVISKVFEYCFLDRFQSLLTTEENQFGFKKGISCSHAIYTARGFIDRHIMAGSTVNMCAIDLTKAFDKVNHHALFIKLMKRHIPVQALEILENLFSNCHSSVKWNNMWSSVFEINFGVRQGSVLSPFLFALYLDDLSRLGSSFKGCFVILYADDILLLSPSVSQLEKLLRVCERELTWLDMAINFNKSCCIGSPDWWVCCFEIDVSGCTWAMTPVLGDTNVTA